MPFLIFAATFAAFFPALDNGFVGWDDSADLLFNPNYGFGWTGIRWMFTSLWGDHYYPLTMMSFALDHALWDRNPFGYHLTNNLLHAANAVLFYHLSSALLVMTVKGLRENKTALSASAGFSALLFGLHPLRVESVAWATERSDLLSGFFYLAAVLFYLQAHAGKDSERLRRQTSAFLAFVCALLSKSIVISLPLALILLDVYPLKRLGGDPRKWFSGEKKGVWLEKIPFFLAAAAVAAVMLSVQIGRFERPEWAVKKMGWAALAAQAAFAFAFYLRKTLLPTGLLPLYKMPVHFNPLEWRYALSALAVLAVSAVLIASRRRRPALLAVWIFYLLSLAPVLGFVKASAQLVADRYSYLSCLGWALLAGGGLAVRLRSASARHLPIYAGGCLLLLASLAGATWTQTQIWRDSESFWGYLVRADPEHRFAQNAMGNIRLAQGRSDEAIGYYRAAIAIDPDYGAAHNNLGNLLSNKGLHREAIEHYRLALQNSPRHATTHFNWGLSLMRLGQLDGAIGHFREELRIDASAPQPHIALGQALAAQGKKSEAAESFRAALRINPEDRQAQLGLDALRRKSK